MTLRVRVLAILSKIGGLGSLLRSLVGLGRGGRRLGPVAFCFFILVCLRASSWWGLVFDCACY